ncbi:hypothetical protein BD779DRAFT_1469539 [Infundibulicybe gibba]|nr:hypothetical protein BD779DRAFT_1469539 [Infundibulicybe gibba]
MPETTQPTPICAFPACGEQSDITHRCHSCHTAYCSISCQILHAGTHLCETLVPPIDNAFTVREKILTYSDTHEPILGKLAVAMAGPMPPGVHFLDLKIFVVHLQDGEQGKCVHHRLEAMNFVGAALQFGLLHEVMSLIELNLLGVMAIFVHTSPSGERQVLLDPLPSADETISADSGRDTSAGVEALKESERLSFAWKHRTVACGEEKRRRLTRPAHPKTTARQTGIHAALVKKAAHDGVHELQAQLCIGILHSRMQRLCGHLPWPGPTRFEPAFSNFHRSVQGLHHKATSLGFGRQWLAFQSHALGIFGNPSPCGVDLRHAPVWGRRTWLNAPVKQALSPGIDEARSNALI